MIIETEFIGILFVSFFLGIKHSLDVDHVVAVSSFLVRSNKFTRTAKLSIMWALGHTLTAGIITTIIFFVKDIFLQNILSSFEIIVSIMLIFIGLLTLIWEFKISKKKKYSSQNQQVKNEMKLINKSHYLIDNSLDEKSKIIKPEPKRFLGLKSDTNAIIAVGIIQGLASNDELFLLLVFTLGINDLSFIILGIFIFSLGVMIGMISWGSLINLPKITKREMIIKYINIIVALLAIGYGIYCLLGGEGINLIPINI